MASSILICFPLPHLFLAYNRWRLKVTADVICEPSMCTLILKKTSLLHTSAQVLIFNILWWVIMYYCMQMPQSLRIHAYRRKGEGIFPQRGDPFDHHPARVCGLSRIDWQSQWERSHRKLCTGLSENWTKQPVRTKYMLWPFQTGELLSLIYSHNFDCLYAQCKLEEAHSSTS